MKLRVKAAVVISLMLGVSAALAAQNDQEGMSRPGKGILDVVVVDQDGKPLKGVAVAVPGYRSITGLAGTARFGLLPGRYAIHISKPGYRGRRVNAGVRPGETTTTRVVLQKLPPPRSTPQSTPRATGAP
jgi:uncharacterized membrane protein